MGMLKVKIIKRNLTQDNNYQKNIRMKKLTTIFLVSLFTLNAFSQVKDVIATPSREPQPPFKLNAPIPKFKIANIVDSSTFTNENLEKNKKTIFIYFGPDCGHCSVFAKKLVDSIDLLKNTQIVMVSSFEYSHIQKFYEDNKIATCPSITMGRDPNYFFVGYYGVTAFPAAYIYNAKGRYIKSYSSDVNISDLANAN